MPIFQKSVIQKHLAHLEPSQLDDAFQRFKHNYNADKIQQIKTLKEEEYQDGFLRDIFVDVFGYTLKPDKNFNLVREFKNQTDSKKADGAILKKANAIAVIELKSNKTKDLKSITQQAFNYKNNQPHCQYVITSNFQKLRFYIDYANEYEEFDLFQLDREAFSLLYLILNQESLLNGLPLQLKDETKCHEENISAQFYKDYSKLKQEIFVNLSKNNPQFDQLLLFKKSQKFLDRLLFVFFAEDTGLVPPNSMATEIENWQKLKELEAYDSLYNRLKKFFNHLNKGYQEIPAYNGGLFATDKILDKLVIADKVLKDNLLKLATYDFNTELDVNILGHIFEHSLSELEEMAAQIEGVATEKGKTKRKKDGIFYTPKYITQYIVENTLGTLCAEKRQELKLVEIEFDESYRIKKGSLSAKGQKLFKALEAYKKWLLQLKILDPACGSGDFLNQALNFLIAEHRDIDNLIADLTNAMPKFYDTDKMILEQNIFGVDINEESVEIAQLSLWLRTAKKGRKLSNLSRNIKCGNSLIDDPTVAGEKAFDWNQEFPKIMEKGGFDVVIGNPPYVSNKVMHRHGLQKHISYWNKTFESTKSGNYDIYILFVEKSLTLLKHRRIMSFIIPNKFLVAKYSKNLLNLIKRKYFFRQIVDYSNVNVFPDASVYPIIVTIENIEKNVEVTDRIIVDKGVLETYGLNRKWNFIKLNYVDSYKNSHDRLIVKIENQKNIINSQLSFEPGINGFQFTNYSKCVSEGKNSDDSKKLVVTGNIDPHIFLDNMTRYKKKDYIEPYITFNSEIISTGKWELFCKSKIMVAGMTKELEAALDEKGNFAPAVSVYNICGKLDVLKQLIIIINSRLINWFFKHKFSDKHLAGGYISVNNLLLQQIPFKTFADKEKAIVLGIETNVLRLKINQIKKTFSDLLQTKFDIKKLSRKLQNWNELELKEFLKELKKAKVQLSLAEEAEWMKYFNDQKQKAQVLKFKINEIDTEIDQMVYALYGLTEEEIGIIENNG